MEPKSTSNLGASTPPVQPISPSPELPASSSENAAPAAEAPATNNSIAPSENPVPDPSILSALESAPAAPQPNIMLTPTSSTKPPKKPFEPKKLFGKWYFWAMVGCIVFAIFGIGLATYTLTENAKAEDKITQLEKELDEKNQLLVKYGAQLGQIVDESSRPGYEGNKDDDKTEQPSAIASSDYIYIGEWGIKFKIPEGLKNVSYRFSDLVHQDADPAVYPYDATKTVCISAILDEMNYTPENFSIINNSFGCLTQLKEDDADQFTPDETVKIGDNVFRYKYPEDIRSISSDEQEQSWGTKIITLVQQMLTNPENISKF